MDNDRTPTTPWWMTVIIVLCMIPSFILPFNIESVPTEGIEKYLIWFYPAYVIGTGVCAWLCYPQRKALAWILIVLMLMSHAGMYFI